MADQETPYLERCEILRELQMRLASEWRGLTEPEWHGDTACAGWNVAQVVAHLAFQAEFYTANLARALSGLEGPPWVFGPRGAPNYPGYRDALIGRWAKRTINDLVTEYETRSAVLVELAGRLSPDDRAKSAWFVRGAMPLSRFVDFRLFEISIHDWDIRSGIDPRAEVRPEILPTLVPTLASRLAGFAGTNPGERAPGTYRLAVARVAPVQWDIRINESGLSVQPGGSLSPEATITTEASALALVLAGRQSAADLGGAWRITGDAAKGQAFSALFRGI